MGLDIVAASSDVPQPYSVLIVLVIVLAASATIFWSLVRRWTTHRVVAMLSDWAAGAGMRIHGGRDVRVPEVFSSTRLAPRPIFLLQDARTTLIRMQSDLPPASGKNDRIAQWNLLIRRIETTWQTTGLRPVAHQTSILDAFAMDSFPSLASPERFVVFGADELSARAVARSHLAGLMPPDIGLLLHGNYFILDFSTRHFDPIELQRMMGLVEHLLGYLPTTIAAEVED